MTIADKLTRLATAHDAIISAINAKGGSATGDGFEDFATDIAAIPSGPSVNVEASKSVNVSGSGTTTISPSTGYDAMAEAKAVVAAGSAATPATSITANPSISVSSGGLITASVSASQNVTPTVSAGWVSGGTAGTITISGSNTSQLSAQAAQTITPGTTDQTIASGKYLTGAQTIKGDADLVAGNIKKDVEIFGVTGTYEGGGGGNKNIQVCSDYETVKSESYTATDVKLTVAKTGTYTVSWTGWRTTSSGTNGSQLYIDGTAYGSAQTSFLNTYGHYVKLTNVSLTQGQEIVIWARSRGTTYNMGVANLIIEEQ